MATKIQVNFLPLGEDRIKDAVIFLQKGLKKEPLAFAHEKKVSTEENGLHLLLKEGKGIIAEYEKTTKDPATNKDVVKKVIVGIVVFSVDKGDVYCHNGYIRMIYISSSRRQRTGQILIDMAFEELKNAEVTNIFLHIVGTHDNNAFRFFRKNGFACNGYYKNYIRWAVESHDMTIMLKELPE